MLQRAGIGTFAAAAGSSLLLPRKARASQAPSFPSLSNLASTHLAHYNSCITTLNTTPAICTAAQSALQNVITQGAPMMNLLLTQNVYKLFQPFTWNPATLAQNCALNGAPGLPASFFQVGMPGLTMSMQWAESAVPTGVSMMSMLTGDFWLNWYNWFGRQHTGALKGAGDAQCGSCCTPRGCPNQGDQPPFPTGIVAIIVAGGAALANWGNGLLNGGGAASATSTASGIAGSLTAGGMATTAGEVAAVGTAASIAGVVAIAAGTSAALGALLQPLVTPAPPPCWTPWDC